MWSLIGFAISVATATIAWMRARHPGGFYETDVYAMTARSHRRVALVSLAFGLFFLISWMVKRETAGVVALAVYALIVVLYATSFLRGFDDEGEHR